MTTVRWDEVADACAAVALSGYEVLPLRWIDDEGFDNGYDYCPPCAEKILAEVKAKNPDNDDIRLAGGGGRGEEDGQRFCETCGVALDVSFTEYAVESELEHFGMYAFDVAAGSDCHSLRTMLESYPWKGGRFSARLRRLAFKAIRQSLARAKAAPGAGK